MEYFNRSDIERADISRDLKHLLVWLSDQQIINSLNINLIINCPVLSDGVRHARAIYGPSTAILKGEMVRKKPKYIELKQRIPIQEKNLKHHPDCPLHMDSCLINRHPYFTTITSKVNYRTIWGWCGQGRKDILKRIQTIGAWHTNRGSR